MADLHPRDGVGLMSWYDEKRDGPDKQYLEWCFHEELEPDEEPGFYRPKTGGTEG